MEAGSKAVISNIFNNINRTLSDLSTEHLRLNYLQKLNSYIPPTSIFFGQYPCSEKWQIVFKKAEGQMINLRRVLQLFLELPNVFDTIFQYLQQEQTSCGTVTSFLSGSLWKLTKASCDENKIYLPFAMYYDDFECCNSLGTKAGIYKLEQFTYHFYVYHLNIFRC